MDDQPPPPGPNAFLAGLREHRVYRVALGYGVGAWVILQVAAIVLPGFGAPPWVLRMLVILLAPQGPSGRRTPGDPAQN